MEISIKALVDTESLSSVQKLQYFKAIYLCDGDLFLREFINLEFHLSLILKRNIKFKNILNSNVTIIVVEQQWTVFKVNVR